MSARSDSLTNPSRVLQHQHHAFEKTPVLPAQVDYLSESTHNPVRCLILPAWHWHPSWETFDKEDELHDKKLLESPRLGLYSELDRIGRQKLLLQSVSYYACFTCVEHLKGVSHDYPYASVCGLRDIQPIIDIKVACTTAENMYDYPIFQERHVSW
jgi:hypothetical protein